MLDQIAVQPLRWVQVRRAVLTAIAAFFFGIGWGAFHLLHAVKVGLTGLLFALGYAASWSFAAVKVGWQAGRGSA